MSDATEGRPMDEPVVDLRRYVIVDWIGAMNDPDFPLPWWCGVPHEYKPGFEDDESWDGNGVVEGGGLVEEGGEPTPELEEPSLTSWLESMLLAMCDLTEFRRQAEAHKVDHVMLNLDPHARKKTTRFTGIQAGHACVEVFVSPELQSSRDVLQVASALLSECLIGLRLIARRLDISPPTLRMWPGASVPLTVRQHGRIASVANCLPDTERFAVCTGHASSTENQWPMLVRHGLERVTLDPYAIDVIGNPSVPSVADLDAQYDFTAFDQPMFIGELLRYAGVALVGFQRRGHGTGQSDRIATMESIVQEQTGLALRSRGIDGDIRWAAFGEPPDVITPFDDSFEDA